MIKEAFDWLKVMIEKAHGPQDPILYEGKPYHDGSLRELEEPQCEPVGVATLGGIVDYVLKNPDKYEREFIVSIISPTKAIVTSPLFGPFKQRDIFVEASLSLRQFQFNNFQPYDEFMIGLQAWFEDSEDKAAILKLIGNITSENSTNTEDDGVTQRVQVRAGITKRAEVPVQNPYLLIPMRTFPDIMQPASNFILRVQDTGGKPNIGLWEADREHWKVVAIDRIHELLKKQIGDEAIILR